MPDLSLNSLERSALEAISGRYPARVSRSGSIFLASFSTAGEAEKCWLPISHLNTLPPIFGQINPTLDILLNLAMAISMLFPLSTDADSFPRVAGPSRSGLPWRRDT